MLEAGVPADHIHVIPDEQQAIDTALRRARRGDLVMIFADAIARSWKQVIYFSPEAEAAPAPAVLPLRVSAPVDEMPLAALGGEAQFVQDERGVRLARESED